MKLVTKNYNTCDNLQTIFHMKPKNIALRVAENISHYTRCNQKLIITCHKKYFIYNQKDRTCNPK